MKTILLLWFVLAPVWAMAQDCTLEQYQKMLFEANQAVKEGQYDLAINKLQSANTCQPQKEVEVNKMILEVYEKVNEERKRAIKNEQEAIRLQKIAQENEREAKRQAEIAKNNAEEASRQKQIAEIQRDSTEKQKNIAINEKLRAEKSNRATQNAALFQKAKENNSTLALSIAKYNLLKYPNDPNSLINYNEMTLDSASFYFEKSIPSNDSIVYSYDAKYFAVIKVGGYNQKNVSIYEANTREKVAVLSGHQAPVTAAVFTPNDCGQLLLTYSLDGAVKFWEIGKWKEMNNSEWQGNTPVTEIRNFALSPDGKYLVLTTKSATILYDVYAKKEIKAWGGSPILSKFSIGGNLLAIGNDFGIKIIKVGTWKEVIFLDYHPAAGIFDLFTDMAFSIDGKFIAMASGRTARIWDVDTWRISSELTGHTGVINSIAFSPDNLTVVTGSNDSRVIIWENRTGAKKIVLKGYDHAVKNVSFSFDGKHILTRDSLGNMKFWYADLLFRTLSITDINDKIVSMDFSMDGKYLAANSRKTLTIWDAKNWNRIFTKEITGNDNQLAFSIDSKYLALKASNTIYDPELLLKSGSWEYSKNIKTLGDIEAIAFSFDGKYLATSSLYGKITIWDAKNWNKIDSIEEGRRNSVAFSRDNKYLAIDGGKIFEVGNWKKIIDLKCESRCPIAFSIDNKYLVVCDSGKTKILEVGTWKEITILIEKTGYLKAVQFSPDGKYLATSNGGVTTEIWKVGTWEMMSSLKGHQGKVTSLAFSADSKFIATGSEDRSIKVYRIVDNPESHIYNYSLFELFKEGLSIEPEDLPLINKTYYKN